VSSGIQSEWLQLLTAEETEIYARAGYGRGIGLGTKVALLVVDVTYAFVGEGPAPILQSMARYRLSCGEAGWRSISYIADLLSACRALEIPTFYTVGVEKRSAITRGAWTWKTKESDADRPANVNEIPAPIAPLPTDTVIPKTKPSAFFGTPLSSYLTALGVDTVVVTGGTTSGCVRATVVDAFSQNLRVAVPIEAVFDRARVPHIANLLDIDSKYGDVLPTASLIEHLTGGGASADVREDPAPATPQEPVVR
jgi:nicotinamidase-related amidase